jgi:hypothetical protein
MKNIDNLKLNTFYDPNAIHDLTEINELYNIINELNTNKQIYLNNFVNSKFLNIDELLSMVPDHKLDQMLINGFEYFQYFKLPWIKESVKDPRSVFDYEFKIQHLKIYDDIRTPENIIREQNILKHKNNNNSIFNDCKIETYVIVDNAIICLPTNKDEIVKTYKEHRFNGKNLETFITYENRPIVIYKDPIELVFKEKRRHHAILDIKIKFDGTNNEILSLTVERNRDYNMFSYDGIKQIDYTNEKR